MPSIRGDRLEAGPAGRGSRHHESLVSYSSAAVSPELAAREVSQWGGGARCGSEAPERDRAVRQIPRSGRSDGLERETGSNPPEASASIF
jgi:hypothetical protein